MVKSYIVLAFGIILVLMYFGGCSNPVDKIEQTYKETQKLMRIYNQLNNKINKLDKQLHAYQNQIKELTKRHEQQIETLRQQYKQEIEALRQQYNQQLAEILIKIKESEEKGKKYFENAKELFK